MNKLKTISAELISAMMIFSTVSCAEKNTDTAPSAPVETTVTTAQPTTEQATEPEEFVPAQPNPEMEITWLGEYDLNPYGDETRSTALAIFEDIYGGKINYIPVFEYEKYTVLEEKILSGEQVDMFPYDISSLPLYVKTGWFDSFDPYFEQLGINDGLWDDMTEVIDSLAYNGGHYVIPYSVEQPYVLTYSRQLVKDEKLDDPYELYQKGEWNWDSFLDIMEKFVANANGVYRYGINGKFGGALLASTGHRVVTCENGVLVNNIGDSEIAKAEEFMQSLSQKGLCRVNAVNHYSTDNSVLFYASGDWSLKESNSCNSDKDLMVVPFPKAPDADRYYNPCTINTRMLVKNSQKGAAVAAYLKCERIAATEEGFKAAAKEQATQQHLDYFVTEEQYDALQEFCTPTSVFPIFDFAYGMGGGVFGTDSSNNGAAMNVISNAFITGSAYASWDGMRDAYSPVISGEVDRINAMP